ncbi:hypothetical protein L6164_000566 [Bauhinia variegata]|uniref:Uncharacterized protein n=1 Tax=Bauhinia variegata TaxID=167791 RepID=A0ACB9Q660_BAUVA|nr:hypothetical protein L6164_000566 [Bauhinia variegata]
MSKLAEDMVFSTDLKKVSSKQQSSSKMAKERAVSPQSKRSSKDPDILSSNYDVGPSFSDPRQKRRHGADSRNVQATRNRSQESIKGSATERDELVKHMSNLPDYLRRPDRGENIQEKALNFGVLDWSRLEKWNNKQKHVPAQASKYTSFSNCELSSRTAIKSSTNASNSKFSDLQHMLSSSMKSSYKDGLPDGADPPLQNVRRFQDSETETKSSRDEQRKKPWISNSSGKSYSGMPIEKEKRKDFDKMSSQVGNLSSNLRKHGVSMDSNENTSGKDDEADENMGGSREFSLKLKGKSHKSSSDFALISKNKGVSHDFKKNLSSSKSKTEKKQMQEADVDVDYKKCHIKPSNIVLLRPRKTLQPSSREVIQLSHLRILSDEHIAESSQSCLSNDSLSEEIFSEEFSDIPHSCALPSSVEPAATADTIRHRRNTDWGRDHSSVLSQAPACSEKVSTLHSEGTCTERDAMGVELTDQYVIGKLKESLDHETAELTAKRDRSSSPSRRFSFSLSRIGRSFSFKEGSNYSQYSSTHVSAQSGPLTSVSARLDNPRKEKANGHNRTRSSTSPLRRLLDSILKHKTATHHRAESSDTAKGILDSISFRTNSVDESLHIEKSEGSMIQALLQLTIKNGLPLFKFVLNNNDKNILAAAMKNLAPPGKDDAGCNFTFYLVSEIKKKGGSWISQGSKEKNCGYVYNVVGHMKVSSSKITEPSSQNSKRQCKVKEYVLLGVASRIEKGLPKFSQSRELGAVVVEIPCESLSQKELCSDKNLLSSGCLKCLAEDRCSCDSGENEALSSTTVILPGAMHGSPDEGEPSPLIYRWKSGGSCDCGGWDIGCKLLVLSNQKQNSKSFPCRFQLFEEEGADENGPLFSLVPLKDGSYMVEFHSSITHLQAFFMSITVLSSQKLAGSIEMSKMHEEIAKEPSLKDNGGFHGNEPVRYTPIPPLSPVGRV